MMVYLQATFHLHGLMRLFFFSPGTKFRLEKLQEGFDKGTLPLEQFTEAVLDLVSKDLLPAPAESDMSNQSSSKLPFPSPKLLPLERKSSFDTIPLLRSEDVRGCDPPTNQRGCIAFERIINPRTYCSPV